ncbi:MAG: TrkA family potassium uptake protein [Actinomycetota bacterium]|nr:TrkA family potassium uptake protein [Actinomycetota bacterium]
MYIVVAGAGAVGEQVARALVGAGNTVAVVDADPGRAADLAARGFAVTAGDAGVAETLEAAGALQADVLVACTGKDDDNLVISLLARRRLEVPRVVARLNDEGHRWLFDETWGVDAAISSAGALVNLIEEATGSARIVRLADLSAAALILVEASVTGASAARGHAAADLPLASGDLVAAVVRQGRPVPAADAQRLRAGDRVLVVTDPGGEERVRRAFYPDDELDDPERPAGLRGPVQG